MVTRSAKPGRMVNVGGGGHPELAFDNLATRLGCAILSAIAQRPYQVVVAVRAKLGADSEQKLHCALGGEMQGCTAMVVTMGRPRDFLAALAARPALAGLPLTFARPLSPD